MQITNELDGACAAVASLKDWLDRRLPDKNFVDRHLFRQLIASQDIATGWNSRADNEPKVLDGCVFAQIVIPFCDPYFGTSSATEKVDPFRVLAGAYYKSPLLTHQKAAELADILDSHAGGDQEAAHYVRLGPFDLYVASEGKNRVSVYRRIERKIFARVCQGTYPSPHELMLRHVKPWSNIAALEYIGTDPQIRKRPLPMQVLRHNQPNIVLLAYPESVELLEAYGVAWGKPISSPMAPIHVRKLRIKVGHTLYVR